MSNLKKIQHRVQRDTSNREKAELKKNIKELKRKIKRLEKELTKGLPALEEQILAEQIEDLTVEANEQVFNHTLCPLCGHSALFTYTTPNGKTIQGCKKCRKHRKML